MKLLFFLFLLSPSLTLDLNPEPRKQNIVTKFLDDILNQLFEKLSGEGVSIPLLDLKEVGNFSNAKAKALGLTKRLDGILSHGFKLHVTASMAAACGQYHLVHLDVPGLFPIYGKGDFCVVLEEINLKITLQAFRDFDKGKFEFKLPEFSVQVQSSKVKFENLMEDPKVADFLNELLTNIVPELLPVVAEKLRTDNRALPSVLDKYGNGAFDCLKLGNKDAILQCLKDLLRPHIAFSDGILKTASFGS